MPSECLCCLLTSPCSSPAVGRHNECCRADECFHGARKTISAYLERFGENVTIATVDGSDSHGCHNGLWRDLPRTHVHFVREPTLAKVRVAPPSDPLPCESDL